MMENGEKNPVHGDKHKKNKKRAREHREKVGIKNHVDAETVVEEESREKDLLSRGSSLSRKKHNREKKDESEKSRKRHKKEKRDAASAPDVPKSARTASQHEAPEELRVVSQQCIGTSNFPYKYVLAPMVGASELAFRLLCRKYGADLCYTPMMNAQSFAHDAAYRETEFQTCPEDRPLVCHFSANRPEDFEAAVKVAAPYCDAIDLNLGCPQRTAYLGHFGSYLLDPKDRDLVCSIVRAGVAASDKPICCKIRLLDTIDETVQLCQQLEQAGVSWIAVHARYRASWERQGPGARDGPALLDQVQIIKQHVKIPVIANGNVITFQDVVDNLQSTNADAIMSAEGILDNPALFLPRWGTRKDSSAVPLPSSTSLFNSQNQNHIDEASFSKKKRKLLKRLREIDRLEKRSNLSEEERDKVSKRESLTALLRDLEGRIDSPNATVNNSCQQTVSTISLVTLYEAADNRLQLAVEYAKLVRLYPVKIRSVVFHMRRMIKDDLIRYQLMEDLLACEDVDQVHSVLHRIDSYHRHPESFVYDREKAKGQKEALERKRLEEGKRKAFEARMMRKAKREGKDLNHYLNIGAAVPTRETVERLKGMAREEALQVWKKDHSQHCMSFHLDVEGCKRGRTCAFLHVDANSFVEGDEVAG